MFHLIYTLYYLKFSSNLFDEQYFRALVRVAGLLLPIVFRLTSRHPKYSIKEKVASNDVKVVASLTTFPSRVDQIWIVIESIFRQEVKPDIILLWLSKDEFADKSVLPQNLLNLERRGLQIRFCEGNLMAHKKYFYAMRLFPDAAIVTLDDDMIYPNDLFYRLIKANERFPTSICCAIGRKINSLNGKISFYHNWEYVRKNTLPSFDIIPIGSGGVLYPPASLSPELFNKDLLMQMSLKTDDLWLKVMSVLNKTKVVCIGGEYSRFHIPVIQKNKVSLMDTNIGEFQNDKNFKRLVEYYQIPVTIFES